ncbi:MAG: phosphotransferase [Victivallales bacterium]|nr:phosphotransferase [Victivallales bacterium]
MAQWLPSQDCSAEAASAALGLPITDLRIIQRNQYCAIYRGLLADGDRCIVKTYFGSDPELARIETQAADFYRDVVVGLPEVHPGGALAFVPEANILALRFVPGTCFTDAVYAAVRHPAERPRILTATRRLGEILRQLYDASQTQAAIDPFMGEYASHASGRLERLPWPLRRLFAGSQANALALWAAWQADEPVVSFCHGDCTFRNLHLDGGTIGLIDFANARWNSHILNDCYNFRLAAQNMFLPRSFRDDILTALVAGMGDVRFPESTHHFFHEYHRRRWLMLKLTARNPWAWFQACRALATFAHPFHPEQIGPFRSLLDPQTV